MTPKIRTIAIFHKPFKLPTLNETLPAGEYEIETEISDAVGVLSSPDWTTKVQVKLQPRAQYPGLSRTLTVALVDLQQAMAKDKQTNRDLVDYFLEEMLADPLIRLVMQADSVSDSEVRHYSAQARRVPSRGKPATIAGTAGKPREAVQTGVSVACAAGMKA